MVLIFADDPFDTNTNDKHGTDSARGHATVKSGIFDGNADAGGLDDGILFGMDGANTVLGDVTIFISSYLNLMTDVITVRQARRRANVTGNHNVVVADDDTADHTTITGGSFGNGIGDFDEVFIP